MKTFLKIFIPIFIVSGIVYFAFKKVEPIDDTKKLYIACNKITDNYDIYSGTDIAFASKDNKCKINMTIENVDRNYLKIKADIFLLKLDGNGKIDENTISKDKIGRASCRERV